MTDIDQESDNNLTLDAMQHAAGAFAQVAKGRWESSLEDPRWVNYEDGSRTLMVSMGDSEDAALIAFYHVPSTYRFEPHAHHSHYITYIISGAMRVGRTWYGPGDIRIQEEGSVYGPEEAGPDGCTMINMFANRRGAVPRLLPDGRYFVDPSLLEAAITMSDVHDPFSRPPTAD
jgi:hypothetical protein